MKWPLLLILPLIMSTTAAIRIPVDNKDVAETISPSNSTTESAPLPIYYESDEDRVDSYLIPPSPHNEEEVLPDTIIKPATYLLPPSVEKENDYYYASTESTAQSDWYPIAQTESDEQPPKLLPLRQQSAPIPIFMSNDNQSGLYEIYQRPRAAKALKIRVPSLKLEPPAEDAPNEFFINVPSKELELPAEEIDQQYVQPHGEYPDLKFRINVDEHPTLASHLTPPRLVYRKFKNPTKLYPKKYPGTFKPVPIPIEQYADELPLEAPKAKPFNYFKPTAGIEGLTEIPIDEKKIYLFEQAEEKRKFQEENEARPDQDEPVAPTNNYEVIPPAEQDASETNYGYPRHNIYHPPPSAPLRYRQGPYHAPAHAPAPTPAPAPAPQVQQQGPPAPDDRTEFRMHGMKGPHSYQFGYDTGKGKNRQFRYEERDNDGLVRGHYGYMDKHGKLRVVNYRAHPEYGFQAEPQEEPQVEPKTELQEQDREH